MIPGDGSEVVVDKHDLIIQLQGGPLQHTSQLSQAYSTLHYILIFPQGEEGWHDDIPMVINEGGHACAKKVTQRLYYAYRLYPTSKSP
jgi:hypothetical protein